ncbi:MAG: amidohydrolase, partial [Bacteroidota bacterium]
MKSLLSIVLVSFWLLPLWGQRMPDCPEREEGDGPFSQLIIRGATLINGTGAPPIGPVDVVVENDRITAVRVVGYPGVAIDEGRRPKAKAGAREIEAEGMYLLPGFVDMHGHIG